MYWDLTEIRLAAYMLVFCRMGGMLFFNPIFGRKNVPAQMRVALAAGLTLILAPLVGGALPEEVRTFALLLMMSKELFVGVACGIAFQFFFYMLFFAGDVIDTGFGLSMAKVFDPGSNVQISLTGNLLQMIFILYIFTTDSHLLFIRLMVSSYDIVSIGAVTIGAEVGSFLVGLFITAFSLMIQLTLPFLAASFVLEISMGILMKLISQINVFSIHFQFKIMFGLLLMFLFAVPVANFMNGYVETMFLSVHNLLGTFR